MPSPYCILYHFNLGYPLLSEDAELEIEPKKTTAGNPQATNNIAHFKHFSVPQAGFEEQLFHHQLASDYFGYAEVKLKNIALGMALTMRIKTAQLPFLTQWKMLGEGEYVLGLEPCNVTMKNRKTLRDENILPLLQAGESVTNCLEILLQVI
jgi:hypothetical protein